MSFQVGSDFDISQVRLDNKNSSYFLDSFIFARVFSMDSASVIASSLLFSIISAYSRITRGIPSLTKALIDFPVSSLILLSNLYKSAGTSTVTLLLDVLGIDPFPSILFSIDFTITLQHHFFCFIDITLMFLLYINNSLVFLIKRVKELHLYTTSYRVKIGKRFYHPHAQKGTIFFVFPSFPTFKTGGKT